VPAAIPTPLPLWAKAILQIAPFAEVALPWLLDKLDFGAEEVDPLEWRRYEIGYTRPTPSGTVEDKAWWTMDIANITGGALDASWTSGDYSAVLTAYNTLMGSLNAQMANAVTEAEVRVYKRAFNSMDNPKPFAESGPPEVIYTPARTGTAGTTTVPYQIACSVTEKTPWPGHWGRAYLPNFGVGKLDANGRWTSATTSSVAAAFGTFATSLQASGFFLVVPVTQVAKQPFRALLPVTSIQVDDIPDVQRRRRPKQPAIRSHAP
jgi:hypothetical protein